MQVKLSQLINRPVEGNLRGYCVFCGTKTERGSPLSKVVSNNFSAFPLLGSGDTVCEYCAGVFLNQDFRKRSWVATEGVVEFGKLKEIGQKIFDPPPPPFVIYLTKGGQKQGFIRALSEGVSFSRERFYVYTDWIDIPVFVDSTTAEEYRHTAESLLQRKVTRTELLTGQFTPKTWRKAIEGGWEELLEEIQGYARNPLWEVVCHVV